MDLSFLLTRGADLAILGVHLHGFELPAAPASGPPTAVAAAAGSCIVVTLPPQHVLEETVHPGAPLDRVVQAELSGPSRIAYAVAAGTGVPLTAGGVLAACAIPKPGGATALDTWIELPWRLAFGPAGAGVHTEHAHEPIASAGRITGLWLTRFRTAGRRGGSAIQLVPLDGALAGGPNPPSPFPVPLSADNRTKIVALGPAATRLELTSLGGSLSAAGSMPGFRWAHRIALGRDQAVRVEERVRLYPFGFAGVLTTITDRDPDSTIDGVSPVPPGGSLCLRRITTLRLDETVIQTSDGSPFSRTFPFDRIEVAAAVFSRLGPPETSYAATRPTPDVQVLRDRQAELKADQAAQEPVWLPHAQGGREVGDLIRAGNLSAIDWQNAADALANAAIAQASIAEADSSYAQRMDEAARCAQRADELEGQGPRGPEGGVSPEVQELRNLARQHAADAQEYRVDPGHRARVAADVAHWNRLSEGAWGQIAGLLGTPRDATDVVNLGDLAPEASAAARQWLVDGTQIAELERQILALESVQSSVVVTEWPTVSGGQTRLRFPVRLSRGERDIDVLMPMIMVKDFVLPAAPELEIPEFASLSDPQLPAALELTWAGPRVPERGHGDEPLASGPTPPSVVAAGGALLDVVGAALPQPSDTQVIGSLNIVAASLSLEDMFAPSLGRLAQDGDQRWSMLVHLPELQQLAGPASAAVAGVPDVATSAVVSFARDFVENGEAADVLFTAAEGIGIDFTKAADRSGGLAAMQLASDAISRSLGPVQLEGLTSRDPKKMIGEGATLLGFKLQDLVRTLPQPPTIVSDLLDGETPVVRMEWKDVVLGDVLAFRTFPGTPAEPRRTVLNLQVVSRLEGVTTDCTVSDFYLQFPFEDDGALIRLDFASLRYHQVTEAGAAQPPKVSFSGFDVTFLGPLELLKTLQEAADLLGNTPAVTATPKGVSAAFTVPVPDVRCGVFALSNVTFRSVVDVPFGEEPVSVSIGFASRDKPFSLSVLSFGGGGYIDIQIDADGPRIEASLEFGAQLSVDFVVAQGEVHALGGVSYAQEGSAVSVSGYLRVGGSLEILALISVSVELRIALSYDSGTDRLIGRATLVLEIDLTLWSDSIEIDSGEWVLQGGAAPSSTPQEASVRLALNDVGAALDAVDAPVPADELALWQAYRAPFVGRDPG